MLDVRKIREDFPILSREVYGKPLVYLDNAATTQKPRQVIQALVDYYEGSNANVHRGVHALSQEATDLYEGARAKVARFIGAERPEEIVWTRNASESLNLVAHTWAQENIREGDEIVVTPVRTPLQSRAVAEGGGGQGREAARHADARRRPEPGYVPRGRVHHAENQAARGGSHVEWDRDTEPGEGACG